MKKYGIYLLSGLIFAQTAPSNCFFKGFNLDHPLTSIIEACPNIIEACPKSTPLVLVSAATVLGIAGTILAWKASKSFTKSDTLKKDATKTHSDMLESLIHTIRTGEYEWLENHEDLEVYHKLIDVIIARSTLGKLINGTAEFKKVIEMKEEAESKLCEGKIRAGRAKFAFILSALSAAAYGAYAFLDKP
jgi:hypothetical protein